MRSFLTLVFLFLFSSLGNAAGIVVAPDGNDSTGDGSLEAPYATMEHASGFLAPGDTLWLRGGIYNHRDSFGSVSGTEDHPIVIRPWLDEQPVFDGTGIELGENDPLIYIVHNSWEQPLKHIVFEGAHVRNSRGRGLSFYDVDSLTIRNCIVHDIDFRGIGGWGKHVTIEGCEAYRCAMTNENNADPRYESGGWPGVIQTSRDWDSGDPAEAITIRGCYVHDNWGEGILVSNTLGAVIEDNRLRDNWSVHIYLGKARSVLVQRNVTWTTTGAYDRPFDPPSHATGVWLGNELGFEANEFPVSDIDIVNNLLTGTGTAFRFWLATDSPEAENTYHRIRIAYNTVHDVQRRSIHFDEIPDDRQQPTICLLVNNILDEGQQGYAEIGDPQAWIGNHNIWRGAASLPEIADEASALTGEPLFTDATITDTVYAEGFRLLEDSPGIGAGTPVGWMPFDFWGVDRDSESPCIGFHEATFSSVPNLQPEVSRQPAAIRILQASPNPFNEQTRVAFELDRARTVQLRLVNGLGRVCLSRPARTLAPGRHEMTIDAAHLASGIYFLTLAESGGETALRKLVLVR